MGGLNDHRWTRLQLLGRLHLANRRLESKEVELVLDTRTDQVELRIPGHPGVSLRRDGKANLETLAKTPLICHRGLGFAKGLQNSLDSFRQAWLFGCSGAELDITVPYEKIGNQRVPRTNQLRVHHPPDLRVEILRRDSEKLGKVRSKPTPEEAFQALSEGGIPFVYLDSKLQWLFPGHRESAERALADLFRLASEWSAAASGRHVTLGAELSGPGQTADLLSAMARASKASGRSSVSWALELTRGTDEGRFYQYATGSTPPGLLSFSLLRIRGGRTGILGWLLRDLPRGREAAYRAFPQEKIFWTAKKESQLRGALSAFERLESVDHSGGRVAIMTPYPHRFAYFLASESPSVSGTEGFKGRPSSLAR